MKSINILFDFLHIYYKIKKIVFYSTRYDIYHDFSILNSLLVYAIKTILTEPLAYMHACQENFSPWEKPSLKFDLYNGVI